MVARMSGLSRKMKTQSEEPNDSPGVVLEKAGSDAAWITSKSIEMVTKTMYLRRGRGSQQRSAGRAAALEAAALEAAALEAAART